MTGGLSGKRVVVVGASSGFGRAFALRAAKEGAEIAVVARRHGALEEVIKEAGGGAVITADLQSAEDCARIGDDAAAALGGIDVALFTAAIARLRTLRDHTAQDWIETLGTNLVGTNVAIGGVLPHLCDRGIVAVVSTEAVGNPYYGLGVYAASKSAVEDAMRGWRVEHPDARFVTLRIGTCVPTEFANSFDPEAMAAAFPIWAAQGKAVTEFMQADELADVVTSLFGAMLANGTIGVEEIQLRSPAPVTTSYDAATTPRGASPEPDRPGRAPPPSPPPSAGNRGKRTA